jgi:peptide/nickel transport system substrate-binding protein
MKIEIRNMALLAILLLSLGAPLASERVMRAGNLSDPASLDPARVWDDISSFYIHNIFDTLVRYDPQGMKIEPSLAVSWETSTDGLTWTFNLRKGVRFQDGTPFDAEAVAFSFFRQMDPAHPGRLDEFPMFSDIFPFLKAVKKISQHQVQFILSEPFFPFLASLTVECASIVSPTAVKKAGDAFARQPVGSGPYRLSSWQKGKRLVLTANPDYWRGRPAIDKYVDTIDRRAEVLNNYFKEGLLDIVNAYSISKMVSYKKQDWVQVIATPSLSVSFAVVNDSRPALRSRSVRQALRHAWDPRTLTLVFQDFVLPVHTMLPGGLAGDGHEAQPAGFSLAKAEALLKKEGGGRDLQLEMLLLKGDGLLFQLFSLYAKNLKQIGIRLKLNRLDLDAYNRRIARGDFDLTYSGWIADYPDPDSMLFPLLSEQLQKQGFANIAGSQRKLLREQLVQARREGDPVKRLALYREIDRAVISEGLIIPLYQDKKVFLANRKISRIQPNPLGRLALFEIKMK